MKGSELLQKLKDYAHVPIAVFVLLLTFGYTWYTGRDLGPNFTNSLYAFYAFLAGHGFTQNKWPAGPDQPGS
jgi:hypothetical protein